MKRILVLTMVLALSVSGVAVAAPQQRGTIEGIAKDSCEKLLPGVTVQVRNVDTGAVTASTQAGQDGRFSFAGLIPATYVVEIVDDNGKTIGVSAAIAVAAGGVITGVTPVGNTACAIAAAAFVGSFFMSTAGLVILGVATAVTAAAVVVSTNASGSR
jgi:hypothetical protein